MNYLDQANLAEQYPFADDSLLGIRQPDDKDTVDAEARMRRLVSITCKAEDLRVYQDADNCLWLAWNDKFGSIAVAKLLPAVGRVAYLYQTKEIPAFSHWTGMPQGKALLERVRGWKELWV